MQMLLNEHYPLFVQGTVTEGREAFDAFLAKYPYCYGYWKKYADLERKHNELDTAEEVGSWDDHQGGAVSIHSAVVHFSYHCSGDSLVCPCAIDVILREISRG